MLPEVAHVILVLEAFAWPQLEIGELDLEGIVIEEHAAVTVNAVLLDIDAKLMQMQQDLRIPMPEQRPDRA